PVERSVDLVQRTEDLDGRAVCDLGAVDAHVDTLHSALREERPAALGGDLLRVLEAWKPNSHALPGRADQLEVSRRPAEGCARAERDDPESRGAGVLDEIAGPAHEAAVDLAEQLVPHDDVDDPRCDDDRDRDRGSGEQRNAETEAHLFLSEGVAHAA